MLTTVKLKNFKLHEHVSIEARRITVFIGPNNSGKSTIFQALLALRQAPESILLPPVPGREPGSSPHSQPQAYGMIDLGEFKNVLRRGSEELQIGLSGELLTENSPHPFLRDSGPVCVSFEVSFRENQLVQHEGSIGTSHEKARWLYPGHTGADPGIVLVLRTQHRILLEPVPTLQLLRVRVPNTHPDSLPLAEFFGKQPRQLLESIHPVYALRGFEEAGYPIAETPPQNGLDRATLGERSAALTNLLAYNAQLKAEISGKLEEMLGLGIDFELVPGRRIKIWARSLEAMSPAALFVNEGTGATQLPFIFVPIAMAKPHETVLLSEPEAHLHPKKQSELTAFILKASQATPLQFFIETHSEHVLHRILHAVAKKELSLDDLAIYYFESQDGKAVASLLEIDERGGVKGGLPGFFDQNLDELSEYLDALKGSKG